jgi:hypothetical protein
MFRAHPPATAALTRPAVAIAGASTRTRKNSDGCAKRCRSPCEDELRFKELQRRKQELQQRVQQQLAVLSRLEDNILDFYYTHTICYEPILQLHESSAVAPETTSFTDNLVSLFPELGSVATSRTVGDDSAAAGPTPPAVPSMTRYYYDSILMRLFREAAIQERDLAQQYTAEKAKVAGTEQQIQKEVIDGALAAQLSTERESRAALSKLEATLEKLQLQCGEHEARVRDVAARIDATDKATEACHKRKAVLEAKKQEQMDNVEKIKDEVAVFRRSVEAAARDLEKRLLFNKSLEDDIARRKALLRRKRKD